MYSRKIHNDELFCLITRADKGIVSVSRILHKTETLKLRKLKQITSEGVKCIASSALKSVNLRQCTAITDAGIIALVRNCRNIEKLNLAELHKLTDAAFIQIAKILQDKLVCNLILLVHIILFFTKGILWYIIYSSSATFAMQESFKPLCRVPNKATGKSI